MTTNKWTTHGIAIPLSASVAPPSLVCSRRSCGPTPCPAHHSTVQISCKPFRGFIVGFLGLSSLGFIVWLLGRATLSFPPPQCFLDMLFVSTYTSIDSRIWWCIHCYNFVPRPKVLTFRSPKMEVLEVGKMEFRWGWRERRLRGGGERESSGSFMF